MMFNFDNADATLKTLGQMIKDKIKTVPNAEYLKYRNFFNELVKDKNTKRRL